MSRRRAGHPGVSIQETPPGPRPIAAVATSNAAFVDFFREGPPNEAVEIHSMTEFDRTFGGLDRRSEASYAISQFFRNGGGTAYVVRVVNEDVDAGEVATADAAGVMPGPSTETESANSLTLATALLGDQATKKGLYALEDVALFNILCIPLAAKLDLNEAASVVREALAYCEKKRAFMLVDIPAAIDDVEKVGQWIGENPDFRHPNAATYFPRLLMPDPEDDYRPRSVSAGGTVAGIYARIDATRGVWKAPAGLEARLRGQAKLDRIMTDAEHASLSPIGVNGIRVFPVHGRVVWGARTLVGIDSPPSESQYVSIRRLTLMIEESLLRGTSWVTFESNDEPTWASVRRNVEAFMTGLFRQGAFQGTTAREAFYVKCDAETTTVADRDQGVVNCDVAFAPIKPAEFVVIRIRHRLARA